MNNSFPKVEGNLKGYSPEQVDKFLAEMRAKFDTGKIDRDAVLQVRTTGFDMVKDGYLPTAVDESVERVEDAFALRYREQEIAAHGTDQWINNARERAQTIVARLRRPIGEQFIRTNIMGVGYSVTEVDELGTKIIDHFTKNTPLTVAELRSIVFTRKTRGYDETQVDALIDATIEVMQSVE